MNKARMPVIMVIGAFIFGCFVLDHFTKNWDPTKYKPSFKRDIGSHVTQNPKFFYNRQPYMSDVQFKIHVFKKIDHWKLADIDENPRFELGRDMTGKIRITYAVVYLKGEKDGN